MSNSAAERSIEIDVPADFFYDLVTDFEAYPDFLSSVVSTRILEQANNRWDVRFTVRVIRQLDYVIRLEGTPYERVSWFLLEPGLFQSNDGGWRIEYLTDTSIRAHYRLDVTVARFVPAAITRRLVEFTLPEMLGQWKQRAETLYAARQSGGES